MNKINGAIGINRKTSQIFFDENEGISVNRTKKWMFTNKLIHPKTIPLYSNNFYEFKLSEIDVTINGMTVKKNSVFGFITSVTDSQIIIANTFVKMEDMYYIYNIDKKPMTIDREIVTEILRKHLSFRPLQSNEKKYYSGGLLEEEIFEINIGGNAQEISTNEFINICTKKKQYYRGHINDIIFNKDTNQYTMLLQEILFNRGELTWKDTLTYIEMDNIFSINKQGVIITDHMSREERLKSKQK